jgi:aspartokinase-like uncharacterized kinase
LDVSHSQPSAHLDAVVKIGGGLSARIHVLDAVLACVGAAAQSIRLLIVPGGGRFADAVRDVDRQIGLSDTAAHWMAVLAMDQSAHLIVGRMPGARLVEQPDEIGAALENARVPVLAPSRWLRATDPLPHSWDVTSDSIAAWIAGRLGAHRLVLVKPPGACPGDAVDAYFARAMPDGVTAAIVAADQTDAIRSALQPDAAS